MPGFDSLLIANRAEIAVRVARTARQMGLRTVAVHSSADRAAPHVTACDTAVAIGPPPASESYLDVDRILDAARRTHAGAVHPGYGFLAENAGFAQACADAGIVFVGPRPDAIAAMGDKAAAKRLMRDAGVPVVPGYDGDDQSDDRLAAEARDIGFPLMVKAAAGGGGKGMRMVQDAGALADALAGARREAAAAFGSDVLLLERAVLRPRHVEIQVLADEHGRCIALGERDCSVQRRHQKVLEEAPSPAVDQALRERMSAAGVAAAQAVRYVGAGTVEFLLDESGDFFFLEMNTRLQVEHPVTELVTGLDIVAWQLRIAQGEHLTIEQGDVRIDGHAIEARLYAEDPANDYLPATGVMRRWSPPDGEGVRVDAGVAQGTEITPHYDPMIAKLVAHGADRDQARVRLVRALQRTTALGPVTNRAMLIAALRHEVFADGAATTAMLDDHPPSTPTVAERDVAAVAAARYMAERRAAGVRADGIVGWSSTGRLETRRRWQVGASEHLVEVVETAGAVTVRIDGIEHEARVDGEHPVVDGVSVAVRLAEPEPGRLLAALDDVDLDIRDLSATQPGLEAGEGAGVLTAPMHGRVIDVGAAVGDLVVQGQRVMVLEAMKMEHEICAGVDGRVEEIATVGAQVAADQVLVRISGEG